MHNCLSPPPDTHFSACAQFSLTLHFSYFRFAPLSSSQPHTPFWPFSKSLYLHLQRKVLSNSLWPYGLHAAHQSTLSFTISQSLLKLISVESVMLFYHLILCCPLLLLLSIFPSIRVFSSESALSSMWPKCWSFNFSNSPSNEYSGLISLRIDWLGLLAVQGTLKSLLQHTIQKHQFFGAQSSWSSFHICIWLLEKPQVWLYGFLLAKWCPHLLEKMGAIRLKFPQLAHWDRDNHLPTKSSFS